MPFVDEKAKRERREKIQRNRERKARAPDTRSSSPLSDYPHNPLPDASNTHALHQQTSSFYPMVNADPSTPGSAEHLQLPGCHSVYPPYQSNHPHLLAPPSKTCPDTALSPAEVHHQTSYSPSPPHPPSPVPPTSEPTFSESWLHSASQNPSASSSTKTGAECFSTLPYYVKRTPRSTVPASQCQLSQTNGDNNSGVKNVLDGHVWTSEPEDPSNKECIALCPNFLKTGMARLLSKHQWTALNDLRSAYETSFLDSASDHAPESSSNLTLSSLVNTSGFLVRKFINFAKKLADFSVLGQEGQICLLKGVVLNALFIRSASHYNVVKDVWITPKGEIPTRILKIATGLENFYEEHAKYCRKFADVVKKDSHLVALMQVLCLFAPDRPRLSDRQSVSNIYDRYILLLKHYLEARHGFTLGRTLLAAVLTNLAELQALTDNYGHILLHVDPSKVDPLILEVFNLSDREKCGKVDEAAASSASSDMASCLPPLQQTSANSSVHNASRDVEFKPEEACGVQTPQLASSEDHPGANSGSMLTE
ncbi:unnamed protein product [Mesocestoides corti]|uniref:NR LBD domain-containing protein n=1 Tax=Mesocestoides corti TaxID=53468 RepID=A0A0R3U3Q8_MESCO|nr:unnamed protein product [Mesocestoides corti]